MKTYTKYNPEPGTIRGPWFQPQHPPATRWSYAIRTDSEAWTYAQESTQAAAKQRAEELAAKYRAATQTPTPEAEVPAEVREWVEAHKGFRVPIYAPGEFARYSTSKLAACWGSHGGHRVGEYLVAVCQPSPTSKRSPTPIWYDFRKATEPTEP